ncbi:MAG TPA: CGNR zinc finger domain-containing protein [Pilimelia sp.]|nr:CGNR zinc finger domain-containing protein [Pilimelia sp.]
MRTPAPLRLVESFLNSRDLSTGWDELATPGGFGGWLAVHRLAERGVTVGEQELSLARDLREALREALRTGPAPGAQDPARRNSQVRLDALAYRVPLRARVSADGAWLAPAVEGVVGVLGRILAAVVLAAHDGTLPRLKVCRAPGCGAAFYDTSRNASRCWCSMQVCGNRSKTRAYRGRRRDGRGPAGEPSPAAAAARPAQRGAGPDEGWRGAGPDAQPPAAVAGWPIRGAAPAGQDQQP